MASLSLSQINLHNECPFLYNEVKNKESVDIVTVPMFKGSVIHKGIELFTQHLIDDNYVSDFNYTDTLMKRLPEHYTLDEFGLLNWYDLEDVRFVLQKHVENHYIDPSIMKDIRVEVKLAFDKNWNRVQWDSEDAYFRGIVDQIHREGDLLVITDYKTNMSLPAADLFKPDDEDGLSINPEKLKMQLQLKVYAYLVSLIYPEHDRFYIRNDYVRYNVYRERSISKYELEQVPDLIATFYEQIKNAKQYIPRINVNCKTCKILALCPAHSDTDRIALTAGNITNREMAEKVAEEYMILKTRTERHREALKTWIDENESSINVNDKYIGYKTKSRMEIKDKPQIIDDLEKRGINRDDAISAMSMSKTKLQKLLKPKDKKIGDRYIKFMEKQMESGNITETSFTEFGDHKHG